MTLPYHPVSNPPNPWVSQHSEWLEAPPPALPKVWEEQAKSILSRNDSPDIGFRYSLNPYRGCGHACAYCYARPSHQYLGFGAGSDFDTQIVAKLNAASLLRAELGRKGWQGEVIVFSGNTDCYQPFEAVYKLTQACLQVCLEHRQPVSLITKSALVRRDAQLLAQLAREAAVHVTVSIPWADPAMAQALEPGAPSPTRRFETLRMLHEAGVPVGVGVAPIIPGLNDSQIPQILEQAAAAGAKHAFRTLLRLPAEVEPVFIERLRQSLPSHADKVLSLLKQMRGGQLKDSRFGHRFSGQGPLWDNVAQLFDRSCARVGIHVLEKEDGLYGKMLPGGTTFRRPQAQGDLFG
jgi:DNA repair photolyase